MTRLSLREWERSSEPVPLSGAQRDALKQVAGEKVGLEPADKDGWFYLNPTSSIGIIQIDDLTIEIAPKFDLSHVFFMIAYSIERFDWGDQLAGLEEHPDVLETLIYVFAQETNAAIKRGLLHGYQNEEDLLPGVRGRIDLAGLVQRTGQAPPIPVMYDEFTDDVEENRLLRAAVSQSRRLQIRSEKSRSTLRAIQSKLNPVSMVRYDPRRLPEPTFTRLNKHYRRPVELARFILRAVSYGLGAGHAPAWAFLVDMNDVFQDFVFTALGKSLASAGGDWKEEEKVFLDQDQEIFGRPDLSLWRDGRCVFVGDAKYKKLGSGGAPNSDLYQILAYTEAVGLTSGTLIYAKGEEEPVTHVTQSSGKELRVVTLDLEQDPDSVLADIDSLAREIRESLPPNQSLAA